MFNFSSTQETNWNDLQALNYVSKDMLLTKHLEMYICSLDELGSILDEKMVLSGST